MPITIDHQLREQINHNASVFPITYFHDELATLPNWAGPLHWHPEFEIATAVCGILDFQVGQKHLTLEAGDSIFVNGNILHGFRQVSGDVPDPMPNIVFSDIIFAPGTSVNVISTVFLNTYSDILMTYPNPKPRAYKSIPRYASNRC